jgi:hypothetical protein
VDGPDFKNEDDGANTVPSTEESLEPESAGDGLPPDGVTTPITPGEIQGTGRTRFLKPAWKKGQSGNPKGRPRGVFTGSALAISGKKTPPELLAKMPESLRKVLGKSPTMAQVLMFRLFMMGIAGDVGAIRLLFERLEGKAPLSVMGDDNSAMDKLMEVLMMGGVPVGGTNEGAEG